MTQVGMPLMAAGEEFDMGDGYVGATRASKLNVDGVRAAASFTRGEVWLLVAVMKSAYNPSRLHELSNDPLFVPLLQRFTRALKRVDTLANAPRALTPEQDRRANAGERNQRLREECQRVLDAGGRWNSEEYARVHGLKGNVVRHAVKAVRDRAKKTARTKPLAASVAEAIRCDYIMLKSARVWKRDWMTGGLMALHGVKRREIWEALAGGEQRWSRENTVWERRQARNVVEAQALVRRMRDALYAAKQEAAE